jgi:hypothetical protein
VTARTLRAADADRQAVADRLRRAHDEGRLDFADYDLRLGRAYAAVTYADLDELVVDLPAGLAAGGAAVPLPARRTPVALLVLWTVWACGFAVNLLLWTLVSLGNGEPDYFWPMWLLVPGTALLVVSCLVRALRRR